MDYEAMNFDEYIENLKQTLLGHYILNSYQPQNAVITEPYPPAELTDDKLELLKEKLNECIPLNTIITDLWDWDIRFEEYLSDDWYFSAVFGKKTSFVDNSQTLADFVLEKVEEYGMDYNQQDDPDWFSGHIFEEAKKFIQGWQTNILKNLPVLMAPPQ